MLEFNQDHKAANLSTLKSKIKKFIYIGKVMLCGVVMSSMILLSGCDDIDNSNKDDSKQDNYDSTVDSKQDNYDNKVVATIIILNGENAVIMDICKYLFYRTGFDVINMDEDKLFMGSENSILIIDENSHEKAEKMAGNLVGENGKITCYDEEKAHNKTRKIIKKKN